MNLSPVIPFEPISVPSFPQGDNWIAQIKWDGVRMLIYFDGRETRLINRRLNDRTAQYPEFGDPSTYCASSSFILDGEMIAFDENKPSFHEVMRRDGVRKETNIRIAISQVPVTYMIFDVLYADGIWLTNEPLGERQKRLSDMIVPCERVQVCQNFADAPKLFELMKAHRMEGIVCKSLDSAYSIGKKDNRWQKIKITRDLIAAVGGVTYNGKLVNSLLLGLYDEEGKWHYIGNAGTGKMSQEEWRRLTDRIPSIASVDMPFSHKPDKHKDAVWVIPTIVAKVSFLEWTPGGTMRQPSIQALLPPTSLSECSLKQIDER
ncbi:RNA ligase family protein [Cohnella terricola]|uniref:DNA ligase (ATP) n=1 Tax=Cohnella terricola TaxID=1289167 RepID=A0A559JMM2_9BACL|nr:RNA ligase family protein [Cohnella terricola]TVY01108.1 DNA ligase [Cohnella terricola]